MKWLKRREKEMTESEHELEDSRRVREQLEEVIAALEEKTKNLQRIHEVAAGSE